MAQRFNETMQVTIPPEKLENVHVTPRPSIKKHPREGLIEKKLTGKEYALYTQFMDSIYDAVIITDWAGNIIDGNNRAGEFFNCESRELCRTDIFELFHGFDALTLDRIRSNLEKGGRFVLIDGFCRRRNGGTFPSEIASHRLKLGAEEFVCFFVRDTTRRKEIEKALTQAQEQLARNERLEAAGRVAGHIAHDFNNLLTPLLGYPALIKEYLPEGSQGHKDLDMIASVAQRMADINQQLFMIARRGQYKKTLVNINSIIKDLFELLRRESEDNIEIKMDLEKMLLSVSGAEEQLMRLIQNICQNAIDAIGNDGTLTIKTENTYIKQNFSSKTTPMAMGEYVTISITDTGHGIPAEIRNKIFDPFFTTKPPGTHRRGAGLGMSVVYGIIKDHKGHIELNSEIGRGTTFTIHLPAQRQQLSQEITRSFTTTGTERILVVDDDQMQITVLTRILQALGYKTLSAQSGEEAVKLVRESKKSGMIPDLVLLDMMMGKGINGFEAYQAIKAVNAKQKAVFISGYDKSKIIQSANELGNSIFLKKPVTAEELGKTIRRELDRAEKD